MKLGRVTSWQPSSQRPSRTYELLQTYDIAAIAAKRVYEAQITAFWCDWVWLANWELAAALQLPEDDFWLDFK